MNNIAICPNLFMYALQNQNVERKLVKKFDIKHLAKDDDNDNDNINSENNLKNEELNNVVDETSVEEETTNISDIPDIPAILLEPSI
jgi:hypothetical protein